MRSYLAKQLNNTQVIFIIIMRRPSQTRLQRASWAPGQRIKCWDMGAPQRKNTWDGHHPWRWWRNRADSLGATLQHGRRAGRRQLNIPDLLKLSSTTLLQQLGQTFQKHLFSLRAFCCCWSASSTPQPVWALREPFKAGFVFISWKTSWDGGFLVVALFSACSFAAAQNSEQNDWQVSAARQAKPLQAFASLAEHCHLFR